MKEGAEKRGGGERRVGIGVMRKKEKGELKGRSGKFIEVGDRRREEDLKRRKETSRVRELRGERTLTLFYTCGLGIVVLHVRVS